MAGFAADITTWVNKANGNVDAVIRKIAFDLGARVIMRTPVRTGRARGNWIMGIGSPVIRTREIEDNKTPANEQGKGNSISKTNMLGAMMDYDPQSQQSIFITNSVPYIGKLEYGSSQQAPAGMVRITVAEFLGITKDAVQFVRSGGGGA